MSLCVTNNFWWWKKVEGRRKRRGVIEMRELKKGLASLLSIELGERYKSFDLEKAVCSHGLFMMAPNRWDPSTNTLQRPLRLSDSTTSVMVRISSSPSPSVLHVHVLNPPPDAPLSPQDQHFLLVQVSRMLRLSELDERNIKEFHRIHPEAKLRGFGRIFRSPTLFEDMIKCILLCNCQWSRTLRMAHALCQLQLELKSSDLLGSSSSKASSQDPSHLTAKTEKFVPVTPMGKEPKRRRTVKKVSANLSSKFSEDKIDSETQVNSVANCDQLASPVPDPLSGRSDEVSASPILDPQLSKQLISESFDEIGDFPTPRELASVDIDFLAKRCSLGYRAARIVKLAQSITEGRLQLSQLEEAARDTADPSVYDKLNEQLMQINGFGPFTCSNVLTCMGFYHVVPTDSETVRHMKKVHALKCTAETVQRDVEKIYGKYAPFQFLAYWSELWESYENQFGKISEMLQSSYQLMTASNMKAKPKKTKSNTS